MRYPIILADIDNTLFDFSADSREALERTFQQYGFPFTQENWEEYHAINQALWAEFEAGKIEKSYIYPNRFRRYLDKKGFVADAVEMNACYMDFLCQGRNYMPHAREVLEALKAMGARVFGATNGAKKVQASRMAGSGMAHLFEKVYISEEMGYQKPTKEYYDLIFRDIGEDKRPLAIMLGDSLTSDMQGGRNAGIATCYLGDPKNADDRCDYVISDLREFLAIVT